MKARAICGSIIMMVVLALPAQSQLQQYFNDTAKKVKATENAIDKREILATSFQNMSKALDIAGSSSSLSPSDRAGIASIKSSLQEKQDELAGNNGFARVSDEQLNSFSDYVVQDAEQADQIVSISLVTLLLILILVVLLVR